MEQYYKKYKLWTLYFGAFYSGKRYYLDEFQINPIQFNRFSSPYYIDLINVPSNGYISYINFLDPPHKKTLKRSADQNYFLPERIDQFEINFSELKKVYTEECEVEPTTILTYFGNELIYNPISGNFTGKTWSNSKELYDLMFNLSLTYTGNLTGAPYGAKLFTSPSVLDGSGRAVFSGIGYGLHNCYGCIDNISFSDISGNIDIEYYPNCNTPLQELKKTLFTVKYNSYNLYNNDSTTEQKLLAFNSERIDLKDIPLKNYIFFKSSLKKINSGFFTGYSILNSGENARIKNEVPLFFRTLNFNSPRLTPFNRDSNYHLNNILNASGRFTQSYKYYPNLECGEKVYGSRFFDVPTFLYNRDVPVVNYVEQIYNSLISGIAGYEYETTDENHLPKLEGIKENRSYYIINTGLLNPEVAIAQVPGDSGIIKNREFFTNNLSLKFQLNALDDLSQRTVYRYGVTNIKNKVNFTKNYYKNNFGDLASVYMDAYFNTSGITGNTSPFRFSISGKTFVLEKDPIGVVYNEFSPIGYVYNSGVPGIYFQPRSTMFFTGGFTGGLPISIFFVESGIQFSGQKTIQSLNRSGYMTTRNINTGQLINFTVVQNPTGNIRVTGLLTYDRIRNPLFRSDFQVGNLIMDTGRLLYYVNNSLIYSGNTGFNLEYMMLGSNASTINNFTGSGISGIKSEDAFRRFFPQTYYNNLFGFSGMIHEVLVYNSFLNENSRNEIYSYLTNKWSGLYLYGLSGRVFSYQNRVNFIKASKTNCSDCDKMINAIPKENEKHIVLLEYNLYGFPQTSLEDCDIDMHAYILKTGFHEEIVKKDPFRSSFTINFNSGTPKNSLEKIYIKSPNINNICDMNYTYNSFSTGQREYLKEIKTKVLFNKPNKTDGDCIQDYIKYGKIYGNQL